jgi:hypothetical protein
MWIGTGDQSGSDMCHPCSGDMCHVRTGDVVGLYNPYDTWHVRHVVVAGDREDNWTNQHLTSGRCVDMASTTIE